MRSRTRRERLREFIGRFFYEFGNWAIDNDKYVRLREDFHEIQRTPCPGQIWREQISDVSLYRKVSRSVDSRTGRQRDSECDDQECTSHTKVGDPNNR
jgi:hypothetical protein